MLDVKLRCFRRMVGCMGMMPVRGVRVMRCRLVVTGLVVPRRFTMVLRGMLVMLCCFMVMMRCFLGHISSYPADCRTNCSTAGGMLSGHC
jgi:hypothetical protein